MAFVEFKDVGKTYHVGEVSINALHDTSFEIEKGELVVIVGPSGAGKTTLLNILGGMDTLSTGKHTKGAFNFRYEHMKTLGYITLVNRYYCHKSAESKE